MWKDKDILSVSCKLLVEDDRYFKKKKKNQRYPVSAITNNGAKIGK
jgi:hypothetical protein